MNTQQIANRLKELLQQGQFETAQKELLADNALSIEPAISGLPAIKGIDAILEKGANFRNSVEQFHTISVSDPVVSYNHIAIALKVELTFKGMEKTTMDEIIVYQVKDGKIIHEQFFY
ncbi:MAG: nuclear transport factor 2 family protein [Bacteroidia bacterium]|nr:nuclear transport factor 2 family protein [Bacteroidia bacterium]